MEGKNRIKYFSGQKSPVGGEKKKAKGTILWGTKVMEIEKTQYTGPNLKLTKERLMYLDGGFHRRNLLSNYGQRGGGDGNFNSLDTD